jgi:allantoicase
VLPRDVTADKLQTEEQQLQALQQHQTAADGAGWKVVLPRTRLGPGAQHFFTAAANQLNNVSARFAVLVVKP